MGFNVGSMVVMTTRPTTLIQSMRDELRDRRQARIEYQALKNALASYNSPAEIDDLLLVAENEGPDAAAMRDILSANMSRYHLSHTGSMPGMRLGA